MDYIKWAKEYEVEANRISALIRQLTAERKAIRGSKGKAAISAKIEYYRKILREMQSTALTLRERGNNEH